MCNVFLTGGCNQKNWKATGPDDVFISEKLLPHGPSWQALGHPCWPCRNKTLKYLGRWKLEVGVKGKFKEEDRPAYKENRRGDRANWLPLGREARSMDGNTS